MAQKTNEILQKAASAEVIAQFFFVNAVTKIPESQSYSIHYFSFASTSRSEFWSYKSFLPNSNELSAVLWLKALCDSSSNLQS